MLDDLSPLRLTNPKRPRARGLQLSGQKAQAYVPSLPLGLREKGFQGESFYTAPNPPFGAVFTYYLKDEIRTKKKARWEAEKEAAKKGAPLAYPSRDELRAEAREEEPAVVLTIKDADGQVVRRLSGPTKSGFHRVAWDLRFPASNPVSLKPVPTATENPFFEVPQGPLVVPGTYTVSFEKRVDGALLPFGTPQTFSVEALGLQTLKAADAAALLAFERKTARLQRAVMGAIEAAEQAQGRIKLVLKAVDETPAADAALGVEARRIDRALDDVLVALRGDEAIRARNEPVPQSIAERVSAIVASHWSATVAPTGTNRQAYDVAADAFGKQLAALRTLVDSDLRALEQKLEQAGAPWTPGRVPAWTRE